MSQLLDSLDIGDTIDIKGPVGEIVYLEPGQFLIRGKPRNASKLAMLAGGTGITPMYQVIKAVLSNPSDKTECSLVYANQTEEDILLKDEVGFLRCGFKLKQQKRGAYSNFSCTGNGHVHLLRLSLRATHACPLHVQGLACVHVRDQHRASPAQPSPVSELSLCCILPHIKPRGHRARCCRPLFPGGLPVLMEAFADC